MNKHLELYIHYRRLKRQAAQVVRERGEAEAAMALWCLNHAAKESGEGFRRSVYRIKSIAIQHWYGEGRCIAVREQEQELVCHRCGGSGDDPYVDVPCHRCNGTGVYKTIRLIAFKFELGGEYFEWHQPDSQIDFTYTLTDFERTPYSPRTTDPPAEYDRELGYCVLLEYLRQEGARNLPELLTLRETLASIKQDIYQHWWLRSGVRYRWLRITRWVRYHLPERRTQQQIDDFPF